MLFWKKIEGKVISYESIKEIKVPCNCLYEHDDIDIRADVHHECYYDEFFLVYEKMKIQYFIRNEEHIDILNKVYLDREVKESDYIILKYNVFTKKIMEVLRKK